MKGYNNKPTEAKQWTHILLQYGKTILQRAKNLQYKPMIQFYGLLIVLAPMNTTIFHVTTPPNNNNQPRQNNEHNIS